MCITSLAIFIQKTTGSRVVVIRGNGDASHEEMRDPLSEEESEEIDLLMDLIENEARDRDPAPVKTIRLIKHITQSNRPQEELPGMHSFRKESHESHPNSFKEYHIHYHNHQHKSPSKPLVGFDDSLHPYMNSRFPHPDFNVFRQLQRYPIASFSERDKMKDFKEFDKFVKSHRHRAPYLPTENVDHNMQLEAFKDYDSLIKPRMPSYKYKKETPFERITKFQEFYDSEEEKTTHSNKDRFAGFKDFSELEDAEKSKKDEKKNAENLEKKTVKIKDFAIVIKSRPHKNYQKIITSVDDKDVSEEDDMPGPQIPPLVNKLRIPHHRIFGLPRILDAAGGSPKYIDAMNQLKYPHPDPRPFPMFPIHPSVLEGERRKLLYLRRPFLPPPSHLPIHPHPPIPPPHSLRNNLNGWLLRRLMR